MKIRPIVLMFLCLALIGGLLSCGHTNRGHQRLGIRTRSRFGARFLMRVDVAPDANRNNPVAVGLVLVYDDDLLKALLKMSAGEWFEKRDQIAEEYPEKIAFDVRAWEWIPGQDVPVQAVSLKDCPQQGILFADYVSPGEHRVKIDPWKGDFVIRLLGNRFTVAPSR